MLLSLLTTLLNLTVIYSAAIDPTLHLVPETSPSSLHLRNLSTSIPTNIDRDFPPNSIDQRFSYDRTLSHEILDKQSAYLNALLALADLSTKGWNTRLAWGSIYTCASYGDVTIRIHATHNPSSLMYRHAIWGLYFAIRESSANGFMACVLALYWSPILGGTRHILGYVSILGGSSMSMDTSNFTEHTIDSAPFTQAMSPKSALTNLTTTNNSSISLTIENAGSNHLGITINPEKKPLSIDAIFHTIYSGVVDLASKPQDQRIGEPGFVQERAYRTFLRWDASYLFVQPAFLYQYAILAMTAVPVYMCDRKDFREVRFIVYVDAVEVGRGWLYKQGVGDVSNAD